MQKRVFIFPILILLIIFLANALLETNSRLPTITVPFNEPACIREASITNSTGSAISANYYPQLDSTAKESTIYTCIGESKTHYAIWKFNSTQPLANGEYNLILAATDILNNRKSYTIPFKVNGSMGVELIYPPLGYSSTQTTRVEIGTEESSICKYSNIDTATYENMNPFTSTGGILHSIDGYKIPKENQESLFYVGCKDSFEFINYRKFYLVWDSSAPLLSLSAKPNPIGNQDRKTVLTAVSNDEIVCKYSNSTNDYNSMIYFDNNNELSGTSYNETQNQTFTYSQEVNEATYFYYVSCKNKAGLITTKNTTIVLNMSLPMIIERISPPNAISSSDINITVKTSKIAQCTLNLTGDPRMTTFDSFEHNYSLGNLDIGKYSYKVECLGATDLETLNINFVVDRTAPSSFAITSPNFTCADTLTASFIGVDNESSIDLYNYTIYDSSDNEIITWKTTAETIVNEKPTLNKSKTYYFKGYARNKAELWSAVATGNLISVYNITDSRCDYTSPSVTVLTNQTAFGLDVKIRCMDDSSGCYIVNYGTSELPNCTISRTATNSNASLNPFIAQITPDYTTTYFTKSFFLCYNATDFAMNTANGTKFIRVNITQADHCYNNRTDADETDVDCGGADCLDCILGENCTNSSDCETQYCDNINHTCQFNPNCTVGSCGLPLCPACPNDPCIANITCVTNFCNLTSGECEYLPTCFDGIKNGNEINIDCGGSCPSCTGSNCTNNNQCSSGYCNNNICTEPTCTDGVKNGLETGIDCGANCPACENGQGCNNSSDCQSGFCQNGNCITDPNQDTDEDGIPDYWEEQYCGTATCMDPNEDLDGDGLTNLEEFQKGTDPTKKDTDGDGYDDGNEIKAGTDPLDPNSHSSGSILKTILLLLGTLSTLTGSGYYAYKKYKPSQQVLQRQGIILEKPKEVSKEDLQKKQQLIEEKVRKTKEEKDSERKKFLEMFAGKEPIKQEIKEPIKKEKLIEIRKVEQPKKEVGIQKESIFDKLEGMLSAEKEIPELKKEASKKDVFEALKTLAPEKKHGDAIERLSEIAKSADPKKKIINDLIETSQNNPIKKEALKLTLSHLIERGKIKSEDAKGILDALVDRNLVSRSDSSDILFSIRK